MQTMNAHQHPKAIILAAWGIVLLTSSLPRIILQEVFAQPVSSDLQALMSIGVIFLALLATVIWRSLGGLRALLALLLVLVGSEWLVFNHVDRLAILSRLA
jgi:hypothetical protein